MSFVDLLWYFVYLCLILIAALAAFVVLIKVALKKRQAEREALSGPLDLTGETFRRHLKQLEKGITYYLFNIK